MPMAPEGVARIGLRYIDRFTDRGATSPGNWRGRIHAPGDGYEAPKLFWNPSVSPAGMIIYTGDLFGQWKGDALLGALSGEALIHVTIRGDQASKTDQWDMGAPR